MGVQCSRSGGISPTLAGIEAVAAELGGRQVSAGEFSGETPLDTEEALDHAAQSLRANADRSPSGGCWSPSNRSLVRAGQPQHRDRSAAPRPGPNAGLLIDVWHFYNGGGHLDLLVDLPAAGITGVQLNDGPLVHENFLQHARAERQLPGEGDLDIVGLIHAVQRAGFRGPYCVESNTPEFRPCRWPKPLAAQQTAPPACCARPVCWSDGFGPGCANL